MGSRRNAPRPDNRRASIADEAARIIIEGGLTDYRAAKAKAREKLGLSSGPLPSNEEIEAALSVRNRIFLGDQHTTHVQQLRELARDVMLRLEIFNPRLVGAVLSGTATTHAPIDLHLYSDTPENVGMRLATLDLAHKAIQFQHRWRRGEPEAIPGFRFYAEEVECLATVFPDRRRAHAPLSPVDGKPMQRANYREISELIADGATVSAW
jgi:hypothetical protein